MRNSDDPITSEKKKSRLGEKANENRIPQSIRFRNSDCLYACSSRIKFTTNKRLSSVPRENLRGKLLRTRGTGTENCRGDNFALRAKFSFGRRRKFRRARRTSCVVRARSLFPDAQALPFFVYLAPFILFSPFRYVVSVSENFTPLAMGTGQFERKFLALNELLRNCMG